MAAPWRSINLELLNGAVEQCNIGSMAVLLICIILCVLEGATAAATCELLWGKFHLSTLLQLQFITII